AGSDAVAATRAATTMARGNGAFDAHLGGGLSQRGATNPGAGALYAYRNAGTGTDTAGVGFTSGAAQAGCRHRFVARHSLGVCLDTDPLDAAGVARYRRGIAGSAG